MTKVPGFSFNQVRSRIKSSEEQEATQNRESIPIKYLRMSRATRKRRNTRSAIETAALDW